MSSGAMLIAGQRGGKSTFIGAFVTHVRDVKSNKWQGQYDMLYGNEQEFDDHIYKYVKNHSKYPDQTRRVDPYVIRIRTYTDATATAERTLTMMDIPGEVQEDRIGAIINKLRSGNWNEEKVKDAYDGDGIGREDPIRDKLDRNTNPALTDKEEEMLYLYQYKAANKVIFLLNLHKFINRDLDPALSAELIQRISRSKRCLLLLTAADVIGYDPSEFRSGLSAKLTGMLSASPRMFDLELRDYILNQKNTLPPNQRADDIRSLVRAAENNDISMFSVAVPQGRTKDDIAVENGSIKTPGFDNVAEWLTER